VLSRLRQIAVFVRDLDRAVAFYRDTLGLPFLFQAPPGLAFFDCQGVRLLLDAAAAAPFQPPSSILYYAVDDIHAAHAELRRRGVTFRDAPHRIATVAGQDVWMTFFDDTEGNLLALTSEVPAAA
jgi:catechol 2,3-dioxygenase-like lactoylglutathione lyase family enzyme